MVKVRGPGELPSHFGWNSVDRLIDKNQGIEGIACINSFSPMVSQNWIISRKQMTNLFWVMKDQIPNHHHQTSNCPMDEPNLLTSTTCSQLSKWRNVENMGTIFLFFYFLMDNRKQGYYINPIHEKKLCMISLQG